VAGFFAVSPLNTGQTPTFRNPLNSSGPDPWMTYYGGSYYLATTTWGDPSVGLTMRRASTIAALTSAAPVQVWQDSTPSRCCNYWAPEFHLLDGPDGTHWYMYFTGGAAGTNFTRTQHIHVLESAGTDPMGPYRYKSQLVDRVALDGSVLQLNGALYAIYGVWDITQNIYIAPMSNPWTISGDGVMISSPTFDWERLDGNVNEGPEALQHNGHTFIIYSASACWRATYQLGQLTLSGSDPLSASSWTKKQDPVFQQGNGVFGPGHNGFFKSPDGTEDWIVYHANDSPSGGCDMHRTTRIQKFTWNADGSPNLGTPVSTSVDLPVPSGERGAAAAGQIPDVPEQGLGRRTGYAARCPFAASSVTCRPCGPEGAPCSGEAGFTYR
jgi:GH43 family beta-xylosidase